MKDFPWIPRQQEFEARILAGMFLLVLFCLGWFVVEIFKWLVSLCY